MANLELSFASGETSLSVTRFAVHEAISSLFTVSVRALSEDPSIDLDTLVGRAATFRLQSGKTAAPLGGARCWEGICEHAAQVKAEATGKSAYHLRIVPRMWLLTQRRNHRIYQHLSIPDIVDAVLAEWKLEPVWRVARDAHPKLEYKAQYGESDYDFVRRLLEEAGIAFTFPEDAVSPSRVTFDDQLHAGARRAAPPFQFTDNPSGFPGKEVVTGVRLGHHVRPGAHVIRDHDLRNPDFALFGNAEKATPEDRYEQFEYLPGAFLTGSDGAADTPAADDKGPYRRDQAYGDALAQRRLDAERVQKRLVSFDTSSVDLWPGVVFSIEQHPHTEIGQPLLCTGFRLEGSAGEAWHTSGTAVLTSTPYRPAVSTPKPRVHAVQSAVVVGPPGQEIHTDELGRVRIQFPWDRVGQNDSDSSVWIRVSQEWAGTGFGMIALPRVGQEVLISFLDGDPDQPVVVGRLFNVMNPVPYKLPEHQTRSDWKSNSSPGSAGWNEILFEDQAGSELVYQQAQKNLRRLVKHDETITVVDDRSKMVGGSETDTTVGDRTEETDQNRIEAISGDRTTAAEKKLSTLVKGDHVERTEGDNIALVAKDLHRIARGTKKERVTKEYGIEVRGSSTKSFGGYSLSTGSQQEKIGRKNELETGLALHEKAGTVMMCEGTASVTLKGPGGFITIGPGGIDIVGTLVLINEGGSPGSAVDAKPAGAEEPTEAIVSVPPEPAPPTVIGPP